MLKENIKNYTLDELKEKIEEMRRKEISCRTDISMDI